jgi:RNA polymerase sigma-70 factor (ECF subfamily)
MQHHAILALDGLAMSLPLAGPDPDAALVLRCRAQDPAGLAEVIARHGDRLYRALVLIVKDSEDARDLAQETFVRFLGNLATYRGEMSLKNWLLRIATNLALNRLRDRERQGGAVLSLDAIPEDLAPGAAPEAGPEEIVLRRLQLAEVRLFMDGLSPPLRAVAVLRFLEELSYEDIARALDVQIGTVRSRLNAVRFAARALFGRR